MPAGSLPSPGEATQSPGAASLLVFHWIGVNLNRKPFDEKNVRLAIGHAIDRKGIVDGAYFGLAVPMLGGTVPRWSWAYDPDLHPFGQHADVAKAKQLLSQSSVPNGFKVTYINPSGIVFGPNATVNVSGSFHASTADYLKMSDGTKIPTGKPDSSTFSAASPVAFGFLTATPRNITVNGSTLAPTTPSGSPPANLGLVAGDPELHHGSILWSAFDGEPPTGNLRPLSHGREPQMTIG